MPYLLPQFRQGLKSKFIILPIPYEKTTSYKKGTARGPAAIISALNQVEFYDEELNQETWKAGIHVFPKLPLPFNAPPEKFCVKLSEFIKPFIRSGKFLINLGGEHSITAGLVPPYLEKYPDLSVLHLDAHSDLRDEYEGSAYSHACVARRISKLCPITQIGIRSLGEQDYKITNKGNIRTFFAHEMRRTETEKLVREIQKGLTRHIYLTIDLDVFDPSCLSGVGTPEPGGLSWYEVLDILRPIFQRQHIIGMDVVELCPLEGNNISEFTAAKLIYRLIGYLNKL